MPLSLFTKLSKPAITTSLALPVALQVLKSFVLERLSITCSVLTASLKVNVTVVVSPAINSVSSMVMVFNTGAIALTVSVLTLAAATALRSRSLPAISFKVLVPFAVSLFVPAVIPPVVSVSPGITVYSNTKEFEPEPDL